MKIREAENQYRRFRQSQGMAAGTTDRDKVMFNIITKVLGQDADLDHMTADSMIRIFEYASLTRQASSLNNLQSGMSHFCKWARTFKHAPVDFDPLAGFRERKVQKIEKPRISVDKFALLLDCADSPRDRVLIALGLFLFLRSSEIRTLKIKDVNLAEGTIGCTIHKTGDFDVMPISIELDRELRRWLTTYTENVGSLLPEYYLVPANLKGRNQYHDQADFSPLRPMTKSERYIRKAVVNMGWEDTDDRIGIHLLRASGARAWFDELNNHTIDGALKIVQAHLHHASVVMTERYLGLTSDRTKRDRLLRGQSMFPSLAADNVVSLREAQ